VNFACGLPDDLCDVSCKIGPVIVNYFFKFCGTPGDINPIYWSLIKSVNLNSLHALNVIGHDENDSQLYFANKRLLSMIDFKSLDDRERHYKIPDKIKVFLKESTLLLPSSFQEEVKNRLKDASGI